MTGFSSRVAFAAAHVVADPSADNTPGAPAVLDWDSTLAFRHHLWSLGFGVAEAMDTAQRGMGLSWDVARELITRSAAEAASVGGRIAAGAGTDQVAIGASVDEVAAGYLEQVEHVETAGAQVILMASRQLAAVASGPSDYRAVYDKVLGQVSRPVILHWLGPAFDPALAGYWGADEVDEATALFLDLVAAHSDVVDGVKVSLLAADHEIAVRAALPAGVRLYTGDDFNYPELILGDGERHSDALLGSSPPSLRPRPPLCGRWTPATSRDTAPRWTRRCRWRVICSGPRRSTTRPGLRSWPGSTGSNQDSPWSVDLHLLAAPHT